MNITGKLVTMDEEKAEVVNAFYTSVFTGKITPPKLMDHKMRTTGVKPLPL